MRTLPPRGSRVVIYCRYSTKHQDYRSIEGQTMLCREYAEKHGWIVVAVFFDAERSGTTLVGRDGFFEMMALAERNGFDILLVEDVDRASRDPADTHMLARTLGELDIALCTVSGGVVSDMELGFKAIQNAEYVKQNTFKTKRGQQHAVESNRICGSITYGHAKVHQLDARNKPINGLRRICQENAPVVRRIFCEFDAGRSTFDICADLNADGIPSPRGKLWTPSSLTGSKEIGTGVLRNRMYIGEFVWRRTKRKRRAGKIKTSATTSAERIVSHHPELAIIDKDLFERVQARLARGETGVAHTYKNPEYLLTRKVHCKLCGCRMTIMNGRFFCTGREHRGVCENSRRVPREEVEQAVITQIGAHLFNPELLEPSVAEYRAEVERALASHAGKAERGTVRMQEIEVQLGTLMVQLGEADHDGSVYVKKLVRDRLGVLGAEHEQLKKEATNKPRSIGPALDTATVIERLGRELGRLQKDLESKDQEAVRAREIVRSMIDRVEIAPAPGTAADGRGAGPVVVTVFGRLAKLLDLADLPIDHMAKQGSRPKTPLDDATLGFRFSFRIEYHDPRLRQAYADLPILARVLDRSNVPATKQVLLKAMEAESVLVLGCKTQSPYDRLRYALEFMAEQGAARAVRAGPYRTGWVWNHVPLTDVEWKARAMNPDPASLPPLPPRVIPPTAMVVVVGAASALQ